MASLQDILLAINSLNQAVNTAATTLSSISGQASHNFVTSVFGRAGPIITASSGDYTAAQVGANGVFYSIHQQLFTSTAGGTYTPTAGMVWCIVDGRASGGGGGGAVSTSANFAGGGGGGGQGGRSLVVLGASQVGAAPTFAIGSGGTAGTGSTAAGGTGGTGGNISLTSSGGTTLCLANGGLGGGPTNPNLNSLGAAGIGGSSAGATGTWLESGQSGGVGIQVNNTGLTILNLIPSGIGGGFGGGIGVANNTGSSGRSYGAGASGGGAVGVTTNSGGTGASGAIIITEFCNQ